MTCSFLVLLYSRQLFFLYCDLIPYNTRTASIQVAFITTIQLRVCWYWLAFSCTALILANCPSYTVLWYHTVHHQYYQHSGPLWSRFWTEYRVPSVYSVHGQLIKPSCKEKCKKLSFCLKHSKEQNCGAFFTLFLSIKPLNLNKWVHLCPSSEKVWGTSVFSQSIVCMVSAS